MAPAQPTVFSVLEYDTVLEDGKGNTFYFTKLPTSQYRPLSEGAEAEAGKVDHAKYIVRCVLYLLILPLITLCKLTGLFLNPSEPFHRKTLPSSSHRTGIPIPQSTSAFSPARSPPRSLERREPSRLRTESSVYRRERCIRCLFRRGCMRNMERGRRERRRRRRSRGCCRRCSGKEDRRKT